jgi:hypothetical protein
VSRRDNPVSRRDIRRDEQRPSKLDVLWWPTRTTYYGRLVLRQPVPEVGAGERRGRRGEGAAVPPDGAVVICRVKRKVRYEHATSAQSRFLWYIAAYLAPDGLDPGRLDPGWIQAGSRLLDPGWIQAGSSWIEPGSRHTLSSPQRARDERWDDGCAAAGGQARRRNQPTARAAARTRHTSTDDAYHLVRCYLRESPY